MVISLLFAGQHAGAACQGIRGQAAVESVVTRVGSQHIYAGARHHCHPVAVPPSSFRSRCGQSLPYGADRTAGRPGQRIRRLSQRG